MSFTIRVDDEAVQAALASADQSLRKSLIKGLDRAGHEVAAAMKEEAPKGFTLLTNSIHVEKTSALSRTIAPSVKYAGFVNAGRPAGRFPNMQPGSAFAEWVRLRVVGSRASRSKKGKAQVDSLTFLIGRAIARRGIAPNPFVERAFKQTESRVMQIMREAAIQGFMQ
ncbi:MAG: HK97 gp10 family phage protein [Proteobacteria bacterium]|nr:HK97 gp10 family phage protein [Pseudomonadota bacterium]